MCQLQLENFILLTIVCVRVFLNVSIYKTDMYCEHYLYEGMLCCGLWIPSLYKAGVLWALDSLSVSNRGVDRVVDAEIAKCIKQV